MKHIAKGETKEIRLIARVFRAHPKPEGMAEEDYKSKLVSQDETVGHWENARVVATTKDGSLRARLCGL